MKKLRLVFLILWGAIFPAFAQDASVSYCVFKAEGRGFVEVYLHISGASVEFVPVSDSTWQAGVELLLFFKNGDEIVRYDKFALHSPIMPQPGDFIDIKRYALPDGDYELTVELLDLNRAETPKTYRSSLAVHMSGEAQLLQSDIQLLAAAYRDSSGNPFCKNGLFLEPLGFHTYQKNASTLLFYHEVYHADQALKDDFLVSFRIETTADDSPRTLMIAHRRRAPDPVVPLLIPMDIGQLPGGDYRLVVEVRNRLQELVSSKATRFRRENPYLRLAPLDLENINLAEEFVGGLSPDDIRYSLRALTPKLAGKEQEGLNQLIKSDSLDAQKRFLFTYWAGQNPNAPELAYRQYMKVVESVDKTFISGFRRGFETDRGFIYLKYGPPDDMETREQEPSAPPYEIWSYYHFPATRQNNVKFIFYNPSLAPGDFVLLHSDAIGERQNPQWIRDLYRNAPADWEGNPIDGNDIRDGFNRNAKRVLRDN